MERDEWIAGWLFISPVVLGLLIWTLIPMLASLYLSFTDYRVLRPPVWSGIDNYVRMFTRDPDFYQSLKVTFSFVAMQLPIGLCVALGGALLLNTGVKGMTVFRTFFYLPSVVPAVAMALVWAWILNLNYGLVNQFLDALGFKRVNFFGNPQTALPTMAVMTWFGVGQTMIIYLAGLLNIPPSLYEAAQIDGAGSVRRFLHITLPQLSPTIFYTVVMGLIASFQFFTAAYVPDQRWAHEGHLFLQPDDLPGRLLQPEDGLRLSHGLVPVAHDPGHDPDGFPQLVNVGVL